MQADQQAPPAYHDKLVEVYGLTQGALHQGWNVRSVENHTKRLGQGGGVRLYVQASESNHSVYVLMDGEDWWQKVPAGRSDTIKKDGILVRCPPFAPAERLLFWGRFAAHLLDAVSQCCYLLHF